MSVKLPDPINRLNVIPRSLDGQNRYLVSFKDDSILYGEHPLHDIPDEDAVTIPHFASGINSITS